MLHPCYLAWNAISKQLCINKLLQAFLSKKHFTPPRNQLLHEITVQDMLDETASRAAAGFHFYGALVNWSLLVHQGALVSFT